MSPGSVSSCRAAPSAWCRIVFFLSVFACNVQLIEMSSPLTSKILPSVVIVALLGACTTPAPVEVVEVHREVPAKAAKPAPVLKWLQWQETVSTMNATQLSTVLEGMAQPGNANQLFYYGLLNQQSEDYDGWVIARDIFRDLQADDTLTTKQKQLAGILERYNQSRINASYGQDELRKQNEELQQQLADLQEKNRLLEQKIQAITELESTISIRNGE